MNTKVYISEKKTATEALEDIDSFIGKMDLFKKENPEYEYEISLDISDNKEADMKYTVKLKVTKYGTQEDINRT